MKVSLIVPAYNEEARIERTIRIYNDFFSNPDIVAHMQVRFIIVPNGCTDATISIAHSLVRELPNVQCYVVEKPGKGRAIKEGFLYALQSDDELIGFVDADCATSPEAFYDLLNDVDTYDGVIASRYMPGAYVYPQRPFIKRWGSRLVYEPLVRMVLGLSYYDLQCGAKVFKRTVVAAVAPLLTIEQWAFDAELLHLCYKFNFIIKEMPTVWHDQTDSKLRIRSGFKMVSEIFAIKEKHKNV